MATQVCPCFAVGKASKAIKWLEDVAQFRTLVNMADKDTGLILHAELALGPVVFMLGDKKDKDNKPIGSDDDAYEGSVYIVLKDEEALKAHFEHAKAADPASIEKEPFKTDYGSLDYSLKYGKFKIYFGTYAPTLPA